MLIGPRAPPPTAQAHLIREAKGADRHIISPAISSGRRIDARILARKGQGRWARRASAAAPAARLRRPPPRPRRQIELRPRWIFPSVRTAKALLSAISFSPCGSVCVSECYIVSPFITSRALAAARLRAAVLLCVVRVPAGVSCCSSGGKSLGKCARWISFCWTSATNVL